MSDTFVSETQPRRLGRTIAQNTVFVTLGNATLKALSFLFSVYVVRRLGDDRFGQYSTVLAILGLCSIVAELGITQWAQREIARDRTQTGVLFWNIVVLRLLLAVVGIAGITLGTALAGYKPILVLGVFIASCGFFLSAWDAPLKMLLVANEYFSYTVAATVIGQLVVVFLGGALLLSGQGFISLIVATIVSILPQIAISAWAIKRHRLAEFPFSIRPRSWPRLIGAGLPFGVITLSLTISFSIDSVMLSRLQPENVVGWYNVAYHLARNTLFFFSGFSVAMVPSLSQAYAHDTAVVDRWYYRSVKFILLATLPLAVGGMMVAFPLIRFLYTEEFLPSAAAFQIIVWDVPVLMFASFCGNMTTVVSEERAAARIYGVAAIVNIALNLYFIPRYSLLGAAAVTVITDLVAAIQFYWLLNRKLHLPPMLSLLTRIVIACAVMGLVVRLLGNHHVFILIGAGAASYGAMVILLRLMDAREWAQLLRVLRLRRELPSSD